ncbi:MAG: twin-arginine translocase TatA/TatE family subunit [bacterium]|nr:twin-arginine translocase TatA/TatE family subunit [bacterium]
MLGFLNVGPGEIVVILVIALIVLGPSRLPATARTLGRFLAKTRQVVNRFQQEMQAAADLPLEIVARERARLDEPIRSAPKPAVTRPDEPAAEPPEPAAEPPEPAAEPPEPPKPDEPSDDGDPGGPASDAPPNGSPPETRARNTQ